MQHWTQDLCVSALSEFIRRTEYAPFDKEFGEWNGLPSTTTFETYVGIRPARYIEEHYPSLTKQKMARRKKWTKEDCVHAVDAFVLQRGIHPPPSEFRMENGLPSSKTFRRLVGLTPLQYLLANHLKRHSAQS